MTITPNQAPRSEGRWWDLAVAAVIVFVTIMVVVDGVAGGPRWAASLDLWWRIAILVTPNVLLAALYFGLGRDVILRSANGQRLSPRGIAFVALLVLVVFIGAICDPTYATLQVVGYPVIWNVAPNYRDAVAWCFAVAASVGVGMYIGLVADGVDAALFQSFVTALVSLVFSLAMGTWILRIHARGETYRELAEELRLSQDEVAALSKAAGASAERERMSRDLHDTLTQTLTGLVMLSEQAERALDAGDQERVRDRLGRVRAASRSAVAEARALVATTQPIGHDGLVNAIERVAAALRADTDLRIECSLEPVQLPREYEVVLLRAVQEGLANARKHAAAQRLTVALTPQAGVGAKLVVEDDGVGPGTGMREGGFGLTGLSDRVSSAGGSMLFGPGVEGGSRLEVTLAGAQTLPADQLAQVKKDP